MFRQVLPPGGCSEEAHGDARAREGVPVRALLALLPLTGGADRPRDITFITAIQVEPTSSAREY